MSLDPLKRLAQLAKEAGERAGVDAVHFATVIDPDSGDSRVEILFRMRPDEPEPAAPLSEEERAAFNDIAASFRDQKEADQLDSAKRDLAQMFLEDNE